MYARISIKAGPGRNRIVSFAEIDLFLPDRPIVESLMYAEKRSYRD